ncbi:MAG: DNA polymerase III subunit gamma/tau [Rhodospirillales bacterium]
MAADSDNNYRVLARKYRPSTFAGLIGQEALVRTLTNAIESNRIAHAFVLTGVRGIGKTSTARIIARALNCTGPDGKGGPTITPCGECANCKAIAEDRHVDVMEMDAASRTGIDDIRELIESVRYRPSAARYKIYIIDEVHMLSRQAFNGLLKTLEEPPEHVKFIFATTEIRKIPVTVLSRCQRFDLRRVDALRLKEHFADIAEKEKAELEDEALNLIARAADGSVRDGLSLLDQAIAHGAGKVTAEQVRDMLGLADRVMVFDLYDALMQGDVAGAIDLFGEQYANGADPAIVVEDMLDLTHWLTRLKTAPGSAGENAPEAERVRGAEMAGKLRMGVLTRNWQMLLKGLGEIEQAPDARQAAEMLFIRLAYASDLPDPAEAVRVLTGHDGGGAAHSAPTGGAARGGGGGGGGRASAVASQPMQSHEEAPVQQAAPRAIDNIEAVIAILTEGREAVLASQVRNWLRPVAISRGRIECRFSDGAPGDLANRLSAALRGLTNDSWMVTVATDDAMALPSVTEVKDAEIKARFEHAAEHPTVQALLDAFPGAEIAAVRDILPEETEEIDADGEVVPAEEVNELEGDT